MLFPPSSSRFVHKFRISIYFRNNFSFRLFLFKKRIIIYEIVEEEGKQDKNKTKFYWSLKLLCCHENIPVRMNNKEGFCILHKIKEKSLRNFLSLFEEKFFTWKYFHSFDLLSIVPRVGHCRKNCDFFLIFFLNCDFYNFLKLKIKNPCKNLKNCNFLYFFFWKS